MPSLLLQLAQVDIFQDTGTSSWPGDVGAVAAEDLLPARVGDPGSAERRLVFGAGFGFGLGLGLWLRAVAGVGLFAAGRDALNGDAGSFRPGLGEVGAVLEGEFETVVMREGEARHFGVFWEGSRRKKNIRTKKCIRI